MMTLAQFIEQWNVAKDGTEIDISGSIMDPLWPKVIEWAKQKGLTTRNMELDCEGIHEIGAQPHDPVRVSVCKDTKARDVRMEKVFEENDLVYERRSVNLEAIFF